MSGQQRARCGEKRAVRVARLYQAHL